MSSGGNHAVLGTPATEAPRYPSSHPSQLAKSMAPGQIFTVRRTYREERVIRVIASFLFPLSLSLRVSQENAKLLVFPWPNSDPPLHGFAQRSLLMEDLPVNGRMVERHGSMKTEGLMR